MSAHVWPIEKAHATFRRWLGDEYETDALDAVLATAAVERLDGDPLWLLLISGSGNAKTETVQALDGIGATITSTVSSTGALLFGTPSREKTPESTGGLLRKLGADGVLVIKDVTSILSASRDARAEVLAAFREVHDGRWSRNVGTDGGRSWNGAAGSPSSGRSRPHGTGHTTSSPRWATGSCCYGWTPGPAASPQDGTQ